MSNLTITLDINHFEIFESSALLLQEHKDQRHLMGILCNSYVNLSAVFQHFMLIKQLKQNVLRV